MISGLVATDRARGGSKGGRESARARHGPSAHGGLRAEPAERMRQGGDPMPAHERPGDR